MRLRLRGGVTVGFDCNSERAVDDAPSLITISGRPGFILRCYRNSSSHEWSATGGCLQTNNFSRSSIY